MSSYFLANRISEERYFDHTFLYYFLFRKWFIIALFIALRHPTRLEWQACWPSEYNVLYSQAHTHRGIELSQLPLCQEKKRDLLVKRNKERKRSKIPSSDTFS